MEFQAGDMLRFGWETYKKRPWILIGAFAITMTAGWLVNLVSESLGYGGLRNILGIAISAAGSALIGMGVIAFLLKAHESVESVSLKELWHPEPFWKYFGTVILYGIAAAVGLVLLIIPGVIAMLALQFGDYIVIDKGLGPIEALKESMRITRGNLWELLVLFAFIAALNIAGALALLVGLFVTVPVSWLAIVHAYRTLEHKASEVTVGASNV